jgi:phospholipid transport system substrate-binding protein
MIRTGWLTPYIVLLALAGGAPSTLNAAEIQTPPAQAAQFVRDLSDQTMALLAEYADGESPALQQQLRGLITGAFDLEWISRFALGATWQSATPAQRENYQELFALWTADTYAHRLGADRGGSLAVIDAASDPSSADALVRTEIRRPFGVVIETNLRVRGSGEQMKIVDVEMGGVSMVVMQRDEFTAVIRRRGLSGLIGDLKIRANNISLAAARH